MKHTAKILLLSAALAVSASAAQAACYADYKAKRDNPLKLHYGVAKIPGDCSKQNAKNILAPRLAAKGWALLQLVSTFNDDGLTKRKKDAGKFFLRY